MSDETTLLPCPFCGGEAETFNPFDNADGTWCVLCSECAAATGFEQTEAEAIAAWNTRAELGSERIAELEAENERLRKAGYEIGYHDAMKAAKRGGTLTAEQVREAIEASTWAETSTILEFNDSSWQAIADELNVALGSEECEMEIENNIEDMCGEHYVYLIGWTCSKCGSRMTSMYEDDAPNFCPNCGKAVKR